jgi:hypothetical protein
MLYQDAGEEVISGEPFDINKLKPNVDKYTGKGNSTLYQSNFDRWLKRRDKYKSDKGKLWNGIYSSFGEIVLNLLEQDHDRIVKLQSDQDNIGLLNYAKEIVQAGKTDCFEIKAELQEIKQSSQEVGLEGISKHFQKLDSKLALLQGTQAEINQDEERCNILLRSLITSRYLTIYSDYYERRIIFQSELSKYQQLKNMLIAHERTLIRIDSTTSKDPPSALAATSFNHHNNNYSSSNENQVPHCPNCDQDGHRGRQCPKKKHKCFNCGILGHLEKYCRKTKRVNAQIVSKLGKRKKNGGDKGKSNNHTDGEQKTKRQHTGNIVYQDPPMVYDDDVDNDCFDFLESVQDGSVYNVTKKSKSSHITVIDNDQFILDSGASVHIFNSTIGLINHCKPPKNYKLNGLGGVQTSVDYIGYIPHFGHYNVVLSQPINLISVNELVKHGFSLIYGESCILKYKGNTVATICTNGNNLTSFDRMTFNSIIQLTRSKSSYNVSLSSQSQSPQSATNPLGQFTNEQYVRARETRHLHLTLNHPSNSTLYNALKYGVIGGCRLTKEDVQLCEEILGPCLACIAGKSTKPHYSPSKSPPATKVGEELHVDLYTLTTASLRGSKYLLLSVCAVSNYLHVISLQSKSTSAINDGLKQLVAKYNSHQHRVSVIECDSENNLLASTTVLNEIGIQLRPIPPYQHAQRMERYVRTINNACRSTLSGLPYILPQYLTVELINSVVKTLNAIPNSTHVVPSESPEMRMTGRKYDMNYQLQIPFGTAVMATDTAGKTPAPNKISDERAEFGIALGPSDKSYNSISVYIFGKVSTTGGPIRTRSKIQVLKRLPDQFEWTIKQIHQPNNHREYKDIIQSKYHFLTLDDDKVETSSIQTTPTNDTINNPIQSQSNNSNEIENHKENDITSINNQSINADSTSNSSNTNQTTTNQSNDNNQSEISSSNNIDLNNQSITNLPFKRTILDENKHFIRNKVDNQSNINTTNNNNSNNKSDNSQSCNSTALPDNSTALSRRSPGNHSVNMNENEAVIIPDCSIDIGLDQCIRSKTAQSEKGIHSSSISEVSGSSRQMDSTSDQSRISLTHQFPEKGEMTTVSHEGSRQVTDDELMINTSSEQSKVLTNNDSNDLLEMTESVPENELETKSTDQTESNQSKSLTNPRTSGRKRIPSTWFNQSQWKNEAEWRAAYHLTVNKALKGEYSHQSLQAIIAEIKNMLDYQVGYYVLYDKIPRKLRRNILRAFMFIKHKMRPDGTYDRTKARLVGNGSQQDVKLYDMISSSTVSIASVFVLLNIATYFKSHIAVMDIKGAFLHAKVPATNEPIYLLVDAQTSSYWKTVDTTAAEFLNNKGELTLRLDKFIYGLKQSPLMFQRHLTGVIIGLGYKQCLNDECVFYKHVDGDYSILSTHVDDVLQVTSDTSLIEELKTKLIEIYQSIDINLNPTSYLGMNIKRNETGDKISVNHLGKIEELCKKFLHPDAPISEYPASGDGLFRNSDEPVLEEDKLRMYLSLTMSLMYIARLTRPDTLLPVAYLASRSHVATPTDFKKLLKVLRYLKGTKTKGITIKCSDLQLYAHCDASSNVHSDGKGHTGYFISLGSTHSYVHAKSGKQRITGTSSTDCEIFALVECVKTALWIRNFLSELRLDKIRSIQIYQDNKSAILMITDESKYRKSKHILSKISYLRENFNEESIELNYINTTMLCADMLTKSLTGTLFYSHRNKFLHEHI